MAASQRKYQEELEAVRLSKVKKVRGHMNVSEAAKGNPEFEKWTSSRISVSTSAQVGSARNVVAW
jgi:hypothetical protein